MNIMCEVIRDLLPLYHDGVCSDGSKSLVEEHLKECEACRKELDMMDAELTTPHIKPESENSFKAVSVAWIKGKKKSFIKGIVITALICALLVGGFVGLMQWKIIPVSNDVLEVTGLSQLSDGSIVFHLFVNDNKNLYLIESTTTDDGCFYLTPMHSVIETTRKYDTGIFSRYCVFYPPGFHTSEPTYPGIFLNENVTKIYVGPVGEGTLVWEYGMELPAASEDIENMYITN